MFKKTDNFSIGGKKWHGMHPYRGGPGHVMPVGGWPADSR